MGLDPLEGLDPKRGGAERGALTRGALKRGALKREALKRGTFKARECTQGLWGKPVDWGTDCGTAVGTRLVAQGD